MTKERERRLTSTSDCFIKAYNGPTATFLDTTLILVSCFLVGYGLGLFIDLIFTGM